MIGGRPRRVTARVLHRWSHVRTPLRARRSDGGFALISVLGVILVATLIVGALLGLTFTSTKFSGQQIRRDVETRAADSALEAAVNVLRREGTGIGQLGQADCRLFPDGNDNTPTIRIPGTETTDVRVACTPLPSVSPLVAPPDTDSIEQVRLLGTDYGGAARGTLNPALFDWAGALPGLTTAQRDTVSADAANSSSLVHSGPSPLPFTSPVKVRSGAAGVVSDAATGLNGPAFTVGADFRQGETGPLYAAAAPATDPLSDPCGVLSTRSSFPRVQARVIPLPAVCNDVAAAALSPTAPAAQVPARGVWRWTTSDTKGPPEVTTAGASWVDLPATCAELPAPLSDSARVNVQAYRQGDLVVLRPGAYTGRTAERLNRWLSNDSTCQNKVFWFNPRPRGNDQGGLTKFGQFFFDVAACPSGDCNALVVDDPTSVVVFGTEYWGLSQFGRTAIGDVRAAWPQPCDPNQPGVRVELSSRTSIRHKQGLLALCDELVGGEFGDRPSPVLFQGARRSQNWPSSGQNPPTSLVNTPYSPSRFREGQFETIGNLSRLEMDCPDNYCSSAGRGSGPPYDGTAGAFRAESWSASTADRLDDEVVGLRVRLAGDYNRLATSSKAEVVLRRGSATCSVPVTGIGTRTYDPNVRQLFSEGQRLFNVDLSGQCRAVFPELSQNRPVTVREVAEVQVDVRVTLQPQCEGFGLGFNTQRCPNTKPYIRFTTISLEAEGTDAGALGSSFLVTSALPTTDVAVWGQVSAPMADLDVRWQGTAPAQPLFNGSMWFNGLGSSVSPGASTGVVCCSPGESAERRVRLQAFVGPDTSGQYRMLATSVVTIQDWRPGALGEDGSGVEIDGVRAVEALGYRARVEEWRLCANNRAGVYPDLDAVLPSECRSP